MLRTLLICGLIAGACAGLVAAGFASVAGEPAVDRAIAAEQSKTPPGTPAEPELVSRDIQKSVGLVTAAVVYGLAMGGVFALVFALVYGRVATASPSRTALWLAGAAFVVIFLVPYLKYPSAPPAVGDPESIDRRTALFVTMIAASVLSAIAAVRIRRQLLADERLRPHATLLGVGAYLVLVVLAGVALPAVHEIPRDFPATTLWQFREATVGMQAILWATIGLVFSVLAQRAMTRGLAPSRPSAGPRPEVERAA
jgi:predicted cobalt transporter CbtA